MRPPCMLSMEDCYHHSAVRGCVGHTNCKWPVSSLKYLSFDMGSLDLSMGSIDGCDSSPLLQCSVLTSATHMLSPLSMRLPSAFVDGVACLLDALSRGSRYPLDETAKCELQRSTQLVLGAALAFVTTGSLMTVLRPHDEQRRRICVAVLAQVLAALVWDTLARTTLASTTLAGVAKVAKLLAPAFVFISNLSVAAAVAVAVCLLALLAAFVPYLLLYWYLTVIVRSILRVAAAGRVESSPAVVTKAETAPVDDEARWPDVQPELEPRVGTFYCGICFDDEDVAEVFVPDGCHHAYCRDSMRRYVRDRIKEQIVVHKCPHDGCQATLSDVELALLLTPEEMRQYYTVSVNLAVGSTPDVFKCLNARCSGIVALPANDPHFVCPVCRAERCVRCNTRQWHDGLTCEHHRRRQCDSELHAEQLRQLYGGKKVYQCGSCGFGPIEHAHCPDLVMHQNERVGKRSRIQNNCPRCGWFADDIAQWPKWDGQIKVDEQPVRRRRMARLRRWFRRLRIRLAREN